MRQYIEHIEEKNNVMELVARNQRLLLDELTYIVVRDYGVVAFFFLIYI